MKKLLRFIGVLLMGITAAVTLLGGVGTTCVALNPTGYDSMKAIAPYQWLYILYVLIGVGLGVLGVRATVQLVRGKDRAERSALWVLAAGVIVGGIHMATSRALRGSSMPVDGVVYITLFTLVVFLLFQLPKVKGMQLFKKENKENADQAGGATAMIVGLLTLGVQYWAGPTHIFNGVNYADAFHGAMLVFGLCSLFFGASILIISLVGKSSRETSAQRTHP